MSDTDDTEDRDMLGFTRGDCTKTYLQEVVIFARAGSTNNNAVAPERLVARAIQGCGRKERKLLMNDAWRELLPGAIDDGDE